MLPFERHVRWTQMQQVPGKVLASLLAGAGGLAAGLIGRKGISLPGPLGQLMSRFGPDLVNEAVRVAGDKLKEMNAEALVKHEYLTATLTGFRMDLDKAEEERILFRSLR
ncbi:hypothetical protein AB0F81_03420 [Actinoplanes sp. NPDC024001]|uniref:hypothetical protein n=1 Tax=Actinoplanes sp. NPDC024001 TaxID=3154598 RepID=UPI0033C5EA50